MITWKGDQIPDEVLNHDKYSVEGWHPESSAEYFDELAANIFDVTETTGRANVPAVVLYRLEDGVFVCRNVRVGEEDDWALLNSDEALLVKQFLNSSDEMRERLGYRT